MDKAMTKRPTRASLEASVIRAAMRVVKSWDGSEVWLKGNRGSIACLVRACVRLKKRASK